MGDRFGIPGAVRFYYFFPTPFVAFLLYGITYTNFNQTNCVLFRHISSKKIKLGITAVSSRTPRTA